MTVKEINTILCAPWVPKKYLPNDMRFTRKKKNNEIIHNSFFFFFFFEKKIIHNSQGNFDQKKKIINDHKQSRTGQKLIQRISWITFNFFFFWANKLP